MIILKKKCNIKNDETVRGGSEYSCPLISACTTAKGGTLMHREVSFITDDGIKISGDLYKGGDTAIILLHMYTATKQTWKDFAQELQQKGYTVLAIDFRGHGASDLKYTTFTEKDFNNMIYDARTAKKFLGKKRTIVMGASIGANIALKFANEVNGVVALSPAFNYKGIKTKDDASKIRQPVLIVVSEEDKQSVEDSQDLNKIISRSTLQIYKGKGHGTNMLDRESKDRILEWLSKNGLS